MAEERMRRETLLRCVEIVLQMSVRDESLEPVEKNTIVQSLLAGLGTFNAAYDRRSPVAQGIVENRPTTGPMVETDRGWMVPYRERIPGTDFTFRMIPIAGGTFAMGSSPQEPGARADESPQVWIKVAPMWVGQCEVTQREYEQYQQVYTVFKEIERDDPSYSKLTHPLPRFPSRLLGRS